MIKNDRQLKITSEKAQEFKDALDTLEAQLIEDPNNMLLEIQRDAARSEYEVLSEQIGHYKELKSGNAPIKCECLSNLPKALIEMRIALDLTQKELAERTGIHEQQIQRYEAIDYDGIAHNKMTEIAVALGMSSINLKWDNPKKQVEDLLAPAGITKEIKIESAKEIQQCGIWRSKRILQKV